MTTNFKKKNQHSPKGPDCCEANLEAEVIFLKINITVNLFYQKKTPFKIVLGIPEFSWLRG